MGADSHLVIVSDLRRANEDLARVHAAHGRVIDQRDSARDVLKRIATARTEVSAEALRRYAKCYLDSNGLVY